MVARETNIVNAFETTLAAQLASGGTSMNLANDPGVDSPAYFVIDPDSDSNREVVLWASGSNHAAATVTRDIDSKHGTDPTHASGTKVRLAVVKQHIEEAHDAIQQGFVLEDGDGTEVTINPAVASGVYTQREVKFVEGGGIDIDWTDTDNGTDGDPYDLTFTVSVDTAQIAADAITGAKIADDAVDSEHFVDGSIDTAHLAADAVTAAKIADDVVGSEHIAAGAVDTTALGADAVTGAKIADDAIDSEHYTDGSIDTAHIADGQVTTAKIAAASLVIESETITSNDNDTTIPTSAAVKNYADAETATLTNKTLGAVTLSGAVTGADQTMSAVVLKDYAETDADLTSAVDLAIDMANGNTGSVTLAHNVDDLHFTNVPTAGVSTFTLIVTQDGTGSRTMDIDAVSVNGGGDVTAKTVGGGGLTLSTAAGSIDILTFLFKDAGTPFLFSQLAFA
jgi:hypothetical protein|tara:strand:- start:498 stop:1856 length:1359 start_codon:yes stop_codon:yes gene_type:complete